MANAAYQLHNEDVRDRSILVDYLSSQRYWKNSAEIRAVTTLSPKRVRELCQIYPATFVSSVEGYKLVSNATHSEILHCVQSLLGRSDKIMARASALASRL